MTPEEIELVALEFQVDTTWEAVLDGFHCGAPEEDQYCGGCTNLMRKFEEAVRAHERSLIIPPQGYPRIHYPHHIFCNGDTMQPIGPDNSSCNCWMWLKSI